MTNTAQPTSTLAERALARLRALAVGNGLEPVAIAILEAQEQIFSLQGKMEVSPLCESESRTYPAGVRGKDRRTAASFAALQTAITKHRADFKANLDWIDAAVKEVQAYPSQGWGLDDAKILLPEKSAIYAATELCSSCSGRQLLTCSQCNGEGTVICTQCQGQGREQCYHCMGRGEDPQMPGQRCPICQGTRFAPCRFCQTHRYLSCPTCNGKRGTPCSTCHASGRITQEIAITCGAETHFKLLAEGLPSGLRRGMERIGVTNLGKGHADVKSRLPSAEELQGVKEGARIPILNYQVSLPYAELRMGLGSKKAVIAVVGKRCAISGVPHFLDNALKPWTDKLRLATKGLGPLEDALHARVIKETLSLTIAGKGRIEEIRRLYPFGLSPEIMKAILSDMVLALNYTTLRTRSIIAGICTLLCAIAFYIIFTTGIEPRLTLRWGRIDSIAGNFAVLAIALGVSWALLNFSTRFVLRQRFPDMKLALQQKIGKTGLSMMAGIIAVFVLSIYMAPVKPLWLALLLR